MGVAMGGRLIQTRLIIFHLVILHAKYTKRYLNDSTSHGYLGDVAEHCGRFVVAVRDLPMGGAAI
jgi:hypothetical protein